MKQLKYINLMIVCYGIFLCMGLSGIFGFQITFGLGLADALLFALICLTTIFHLIWTILIRKNTSSIFLFPILIFGITSILFSIKATIWRGVEYPWNNGHLFYTYEENDTTNSKTLFVAPAPNQELQPEIEIINKVTNIIQQLPIVLKLEKEVDSLSNHKRRLNYVVLFDDSTKNIYEVRVGEDNGFSIATYFHFMVDAKTLKILNPDGKFE